MVELVAPDAFYQPSLRLKPVDERMRSDADHERQRGQVEADSDFDPWQHGQMHVGDRPQDHDWRIGRHGVVKEDLLAHGLAIGQELGLQTKVPNAQQQV